MGQRFGIVAIFILSLMLGAGCATGKTYSARPELISSWSEGRWMGERRSAPFSARFDDGNRQLSFVAIDPRLEARTADLHAIAMEWARLKPELVLIESYPGSGSISDGSIAEAAAKVSPSFQSIPEFMVSFAVKNKADFLGLEPPADKLSRILIEIGTDPKSFSGYLIAREVLPWKRRGRGGAFARFYVLTSDRIAREYELEKDWLMREEDFRVWFKAQTGKVFDVDALSDADLNPDSAEWATPIQQMAARVNKIRDEYAMSVVAEMLRRYGKILIVQDAQRFNAQRASLEEMLGEPVEFIRAVPLN